MHFPALLVTCGLRDYGTATWEGRDDGCDHKSGRDNSEHSGNIGQRNEQGDAFRNSARYVEQGNAGGNVCLNCGAKRIDNQLGLEPTPEAYLENMVQVFREVKRVLRDDGCLFLNMGDSYASSPAGNKGCNTHERFRSDSMDVVFGGNKPKMDYAGAGLKPKDLCMMPARLAMALQAGFSQCQNCGLELRTDLWPVWNGHKVCFDCRGVAKNIIVQSEQGWYLRSMMPWVKRSAMPESCTDRPASALEYVFLLTKSSKYFFDMDAIRKPNEAVHMRWLNRKTKSKRSKTNEKGVKYVAAWEEKLKAVGRNFRNTDLFYQSLEEPHGMIFLGDEMVGLDVNPHGYKDAHYATFPPKLIVPLIKAGTSERGCCVVCSALWERVVEKEYLSPLIKGPHQQQPDTWKGDKSRPRKRRDDGTFLPRTTDARTDQSQLTGKTGSITRMGDGIVSKTTDWKPTCKHQAETKPCVVFDPFGGSGTVKDVAERLGRKAIVMDLSYEYCQQAKKRCVSDQMSLI